MSSHPIYLKFTKLFFLSLFISTLQTKKTRFAFSTLKPFIWSASIFVPAICNLTGKTCFYFLFLQVLMCIQESDLLLFSCFFVYTRKYYIKISVLFVLPLTFIYVIHANHPQKQHENVKYKHKIVVFS